MRFVCKRDGRGASVVSRGIVVLAWDEHGQPSARLETMDVGFGRCPRCGGRWRLLPCDVLSRKRCGLAVLGHVVGGYDDGADTLRRVVWNLLGDGPAHTTLWGWTDGLGAYYPEDLVVCRRVCEAFRDHARLVPLDEIVRFLDSRPNLGTLVPPYSDPKPLWLDPSVRDGST
ncbi:MAG: hypothetical protein HY720_28400 [Planctomycetes bacterium]|nr:hypothetical protein [Planctomycetota bacterium]